MKANYHTHTYRCNHAIGSEEEYVKAAIKAGLEELGMSDHCPWPVRKMAHMRMEMKELDDYLATLKKLREKYKDQIQLKIGLEAEYFPKDLDTLQMFKDHPDIDYLIFGNHFHESERREWYYGHCSEPEMLKMYVQDAVEGMKSGFYRMFAHPDLCFNNYAQFDETARWASYEICHAAKELGMILEYNLGGLRLYKYRIPHYPRREFWQIAAEVGNTVIIGVDAHSPYDLLDQDTYELAVRTLDELGIKNRIETVEV